MGAVAYDARQEWNAEWLIPRSPLEIDNAIVRVAQDMGYSDITRRPVVRITDAKLIPAKLTRKSPDYSAIRRLLQEGQAVPGAELTDEITYTLSRPTADEAAAE